MNSPEDELRGLMCRKKVTMESWETCHPKYAEVMTLERDKHCVMVSSQRFSPSDVCLQSADLCYRIKVKHPLPVV